jgi:ferredoxin-NADP reductase
MTGSVDHRLRVIAGVASAYRTLVAGSPAAAVLSRPHPVRFTGFDLDLAVVEVVREADDVVSLTLRSIDGDDALPRWTPGAHLDVFLPSGRQRQYSLCGDPADRSRYRIAVRLILDGGGGSREIHERVRVGDVLRVRGPRNAFSLVAAESYLFVAGGIGITPIRPMVHAASLRGAPWRLAYLGRSRASLPFVDDLEALGGDVAVHTDDESGRADLTEIFGRADAGAAVYVCGPTPVRDAARDLVPRLNPTASLHMERFSAPPVVGGAPFSVLLARTGATVEVGADESTLAAIRRTRPGVAYSCQQGFCGSCKTRVVAGDVEHRDRLLLDHERTDSMLVCVSRSAGPTLVLDL